jgi:hypothetical protein
MPCFASLVPASMRFTIRDLVDPRSLVWELVTRDESTPKPEACFDRIVPLRRA